MKKRRRKLNKNMKWKTVGKSKFAFRNQECHETLVMFQARATKQVLLYSTKHHQREVNANGKPKVIADYNATKFAVDIFDEMCGRYAYAPAVRRWPLRLFMHLCDAAALNAYVLNVLTDD
uniref:PiggyBac transposable element-derived protein domain-containing protein n=1 Tax=Ditylenchus dipsaci TaxID=166011 RepID=A0A915EVI8_9BILA